MKDGNKQLDTIDDSDNHVQIDTSEFNQIVKRLDKIDGDIENITTAIKTGDDEVRKYVDKKVSGVRREVQSDMSKLAESFEQTARNVINELLAPITNHVSTFMERVNNNVEEVHEIKADLTEIKRQYTVLNEQVITERSDRLNDYGILSTAILGDEMGVGQGLIGVVTRIDKKLDRQIEQSNKVFERQAVLNTKIEQHEKFFLLIRQVNWKPILRRVAIGITTAIVTAFIAWLKSEGII